MLREGTHPPILFFTRSCSPDNGLRYNLPMVLAFKACPKCQGDLVTEIDYQVGETQRCVQCGSLQFSANGQRGNGHGADTTPMLEVIGPLGNPPEEEPGPLRPRIEVCREVILRVMCGTVSLGCWLVRCQWDTDVRCWAKVDLWELLQLVADWWPNDGETPMKCLCRRSLLCEVDAAISPGRERWYVVCKPCNFAAVLDPVPEPGSRAQIQVVSAPVGLTTRAKAELTPDPSTDRLLAVSIQD